MYALQQRPAAKLPRTNSRGSNKESRKLPSSRSMKRSDIVNSNLSKYGNDKMQASIVENYLKGSKASSKNLSKSGRSKSKDGSSICVSENKDIMEPL